MISSMRNWIISIVTIIIFSTLADILLPKGNLKKLSKLVIGLIVIIVILNPLLLLINHQQFVSSSISSYIDSFNEKGNSSLSVSNSYTKDTLQLYKDNIVNSIEHQIETDCNEKYKVTQLVINEQQNSIDFLSVKAITLTPVLSTFQIKKIKKVSVGKAQVDGEEFYDRAVAKVLEQKYNVKESVIKFVR